MQEGGKQAQYITAIYKHLNQYSADSKVSHEDDPTSKYALVTSLRLWDISLLCFAKRSLMAYIYNLDSKTVATGLGNIVGNKGGVVMTMSLMDTHLCFVGCHLAARESRVTERMTNIQNIVKGCHFGSPDRDIFNQFDHLIWMGDLNYRVCVPWEDCLRLVALKHISHAYLMTIKTWHR
jgi:hypothetical protein